MEKAIPLFAKAESEIKETKSCQDLSKLPGFPGCCDSCHVEFDSGYSFPMQGKLPDGTPVSVCCRVLNWLGEQRKLPRIPLGKEQK